MTSFMNGPSRNLVLFKLSNYPENAQNINFESQIFLISENYLPFLNSKLLKKGKLPQFTKHWFKLSTVLVTVHVASKVSSHVVYGNSKYRALAPWTAVWWKGSFGATSVDPSHALWWMNPTWKPSFASLFQWFDTIAHMWNECLLSSFKLVRESVEIDNRLTIGRRFFVLIPHCHQSFHCLDRFCTSLRFQSRPIYTSSIRLHWQQCKNLTKWLHCGPKLSEIAFKEIGCMPVVLKTMM